MSKSLVLFDTLNFVKTLTNAGISQDHAEAQAKAFKEAHEDNLDLLATKHDIVEVRQEIKEVESRLITKISDQKNELIKWMFSIILGVCTLQSAIILAFQKLMH